MDLKTSSKRKAEQNAPAKKMKLQDARCLDDFSEYVLYPILSYLDATSLYQMSLVSTRFKQLIEDEESLWKIINGKKPQNTSSKIQYCLQKINARTTQLQLAGAQRSDDIFSLPACIDISAKAHHLRVLALEHQTINGEKLSLNDFPKTLEELSFKRTFIWRHYNFFKHTSDRMAALRVLVMDHCHWLDTETLLPISKYEKLEVLSVYMCRKLVGIAISYLSLAGRFGFKSLRVLNVRYTGLGDQLLKSFWTHSKLQEIYFEEYGKTYQLSRARRKLEILRGAPRDEDSYLSEDEDFLDYTPESLKNRYGDSTMIHISNDKVSNEGIQMFQYGKLEAKEDFKLQSVLYKHQYGECKCGHHKRFWELCKDLHNNNSDDVQEEEEDAGEVDFATQCTLEYINRCNEESRLKGIIQRELARKTLPKTYLMLPNVTYFRKYQRMPADRIPPEVLQVANRENKSQKWLFLRQPRNDYEISMLENADADKFRLMSMEMAREQNIVVNLDTMRGAINGPREGLPREIENELEQEVNHILLRHDFLHLHHLEPAARPEDAVPQQEQPPGPSPQKPDEEPKTERSEGSTKTFKCELSDSDKPGPSGTKTSRKSDQKGSNDTNEPGPSSARKDVRNDRDKPNARKGKSKRNDLDKACQTAAYHEKDKACQTGFPSCVQIVERPRTSRGFYEDCHGSDGPEGMDSEETPSPSGSGGVKRPRYKDEPGPSGLLKKPSTTPDSSTKNNDSDDDDDDKPDDLNERTFRTKYGLNKPFEVCNYDEIVVTHEQNEVLTLPLQNEDVLEIHIDTNDARANAANNHEGRVQYYRDGLTIRVNRNANVPRRSSRNSRPEETAACSSESASAPSKSVDIKEDSKTQETESAGSSEEPSTARSGSEPMAAARARIRNFLLPTSTDSFMQSKLLKYKKQTKKLIKLAHEMCLKRNLKPPNRSRTRASHKKKRVPPNRLTTTPQPPNRNAAPRQHRESNNPPNHHQVVYQRRVRVGYFEENDVEQNPAEEDNPVVRVLLISDYEASRNTQIKKLSFRGFSKVTDYSLQTLSLLRLELLDVTSTGVSKAGVFDFMVKNPQCRVIHETACVCGPRMHF